MPTRTAIVAAARRWIGTPYHHQASLHGAGCDCLGLVRGVWRDLYGIEPETPTPYTPDIGEVGDREYLLEAAGRHMARLGAPSRGDVLVFRLRPGVVAKHAGILTSAWTMVHAQSADQVREVALTAGWFKRIAGVFGFPGVSED